MAVGPQESVLAPRFSRVITVLVLIICCITEVSVVSYGHVDLLVRATPPLALLGFATYLVFWKPLLRLTPEVMKVVNPLRTYRVPWGSIQDIGTRWTLTLVTEGRAIPVWASPAESPWGSLGRLRRDALGRPSLGPDDRKELPRSTGALSPVLVQRQWEAHRDSAPGVVTIRWHIASVIALGVLIVATILGFLL